MSGFLDNTQINYVFEKEGREEGEGRVGALEGSPWLSFQPFPVPGQAVHLGVSSMRLPGFGTKLANRGQLGRQSRPPSEGEITLEGIMPRPEGQALCGEIIGHLLYPGDTVLGVQETRTGINKIPSGAGWSQVLLNYARPEPGIDLPAWTLNS